MNERLLGALGYSVLAILPLAVLVWWRGPWVLLNPVAGVGIVGGGTVLLIQLFSAAWHDYQRWDVRWLLAGVAGIGIGVAGALAANRADKGDKMDEYVPGFAILAGLWFGWWGYFAFELWRWALGV